MEPSSRHRLTTVALAAGLPLLLSGATAAMAQTPPPAARSTNPAPSQPAPGENAGQPSPTPTGPAVPHRPPPMANSADTGYYWYWVAGIIVVAALLWGVPRFLRLAKGSTPRRKQ